jgi:Tfp pilus assembly protein PilE
MNTLKNILLNEKGVSVIEITIVLLIIGILVIGWGFSEKGHFETAYKEEARSLIQDIVSKEKIYATRNKDEYYVHADPVNYLGAADAYMEIDARKNKYFKTFSIKSQMTEMKDGLGNLRTLPALLVTVYGAGAAEGKSMSAVYNKYRDELEIKNHD